MIEFSSTGIMLVYIMSVLSVIFTAVLIGKFFYVAPFRNWYDMMAKEMTPLVLGLVASTSTVVIWVSSILGWKTLATIAAVFGMFSWMCLSVGVFLVCIVFRIVPFMQNMHDKIVAKRTGK